MEPASPRILILDDEAAVGVLMARIARRSGWSARTATTVEEFHGLFDAERPDAIMLDLKLGAGDGVEELRFLNGQGYEGPIVLMSGTEDRVLTATSELGDRLGLAIAATLHKPTTTAEIKDLFAALAGFRPRAHRPPIAPGGPGDAEALTPARLDEGIARGELGLVFQPIVCAATGQVEVLEALARWHHPTRGIVMPDQFVPLAERDAAVIDRLTHWAVGSASAQSCRLADLGLPATMAVNVSAKNMRSRDFPDRLLDQVRQAGAPPSAVTLELTESAATGDPTITQDILARLRLKGFRLAMDDFGTGFSSLKALLHSPFSELKIDKSFVANVLVSQDARAIVKSTAHLARDIGLKTVAEGVESQDVLDQLAAFGIDNIQGYFISRPLAPEALTPWLAHNRQAPPIDDTGRRIDRAIGA